MILKNRIPQRIVLYCLGLFILALGVSVSTKSNLGVSPVSSVPYVTSLITGIDLGTMVTVVMLFYTVLQICILRREFQPIQVTQVVFSTVFGYFVNLTTWIVGDFSIPTYAGSLVMCAMSIVFIAVGISLYVGAGLVPMAMEGLTLVITQKYGKGKSFHDVKVFVDGAVVCVSVVLSFVFLGGLYGVREGTVLAALLVGRTMPYLRRFTQPLIKALGPVEKV